jgi:site-specific DNA-methyltransferase (adenine-specific)/site-specific DNA-methyltransferase (cytosine-N4-specific)
LNIGDTYISEGTSIMTTQTIAHGNVRNYIQNQTPPNRLPQEDLKERDLALVPFRVALALQKDGWYVRSDIIWFKPNPPESVKSRPTHSHEYVFLLSRAPRYFYDALAIRERSEDGLSHNKKSVWEIPVQPSGGQHYAVFPEKLAEVCILAGTSAYGCCSKCGLPAKRLFERTGKRVFVTTGWETCECKKEFVPCTVLDPFAGSGTALAVARRLGRKAVGIELNKDNLALIRKRSAQRGLC